MERKVVVITGATGGLGRKMVEYFAQFEHISLVLHTFQAEPYDVPNFHSWFKADLSDPAQVNTFISTVLINFKKVDVLINNAGITKNGMSWKLSLADFQQVMAVNVQAPFQLIQGFLPAMREQKFGRIITISSVVAQTGVPGTCAYATSKAAVLGLTKTVAKEVAQSGITVNAIALGYFNTGMIETVPQEQQEQIIQTIPMKQLGDPDSIVKTIAWLMENDYVTGQTIGLNGGMYSV